MTNTKGFVSAAGVVQCWLLLLTYSTRPANGFNTCPSLLVSPQRRVQDASNNSYSSLAMITNKRRRGGGGPGAGAGRSSSSNNKSPSQSSSGVPGRDFEAQELQASFAADAAASSSRSKSSPFRVVLEDESGHVNRELAESIWSWEQDKRRMQHNVVNDRILPSYSTREGIRLVNAIVTEVLEESASSATTKVTDQQRDDLTQEGIIALMHAMTTYFDEYATVEPKSKHAHRRHLLQDHNAFEKYARGYITDQLTMSLNGNSGGGGDDDAMNSGRREGGGSRSASSKSFLSMESTVGVSDPMEETYHYYTNLDEWEVLSGHVLDTGRGRKGTSQERRLSSSARSGGSNMNRDDETPIVEEYLDEMIQYEGEDEMWIHQQQVAAPLRDFIPEADDDNTMMDDDAYDRFGGGGSSIDSGSRLTSSSFDDEVLRDMIRFNVDEFLGTTLNETESKVIQLRFGLSSSDEDDTSSMIRGRGVIDDQLASATESFSTSVTPSSSTPLTEYQVAEAMGLPLMQVEALQQRALKKLRQAYSDRYVAGSGADDEYDIIDEFHYWQEEESA